MGKLTCLSIQGNQDDPKKEIKRKRVNYTLIDFGKTITMAVRFMIPRMM